MLAGVAVPVNVGVLSLVIRSLEEEPLSLAASRTGAEGAGVDGVDGDGGAARDRANVACDVGRRGGERVVTIDPGA